jgi:esterase/lipase
MSESPKYAINESLYDWCVRGFAMLRRRLGMNISVHAEPGLIESGQIFQFNHFARFETIIPQFFIHQATGAYCRCVADHKLFAGNDRFAKLLWNVGAVPSNHPGLLAFLAAEILRGRKVIIFPEGSMIKDRQIATAAPSGFVATQGPNSAHRQGAAALALVLEIFKRRILAVHEAGDKPRLDRWVAALGLSGHKALIAAAIKPTLIVPANITFHPLHTDENILRKAAELFHLDLGARAKDELLVEGNLVLRHTDMDIRFGKPQHPDGAWNVADNLMIGRIFEQVESLDELFGLKQTANRWVERVAAMTLGRATRRLRDLCMAEMYANVTVNLSHLAARLIVRFMEEGATEIAKTKFHLLLYHCVKQVQKQQGLFLHSSLDDPEIYDGVHDGSNALLREFMATAQKSGLMAESETHYLLLPGLRGGDGRRDPRIENVIRVYANEVALLEPLLRIVDEVTAPHSSNLAKLLFDDELRGFAMAKKHYSAPRFAAVNRQEKAKKSGEPYFIIPEQPTRPGVVLVHGFLSSPAELKSLAHQLVDLGHPVLGVRLKGHGTSPWDLHDRKWEDWLASVKRGHEIMAHLSPIVLMVGFATGASLALLHAASQARELAGVVSVAAPTKFSMRSVTYAPLMHGLNKLSEWVFVQEGIKPFLLGEPEHPDIDYHNMPVRGLVELQKIADQLAQRLPQISVPMAIIQATEDPIVDPASAAQIYGRIGSAQKSLHKVQSKRHGILHEDVAGTQALVISHLAAMSPVATVTEPQRVSATARIAALLTGSVARLRRRFEKPVESSPQ